MRKDARWLLGWTACAVLALITLPGRAGAG
jgi:hypothetical protein